MYLNKRRGNRSRKEERPPQIPGLPGHSEKDDNHLRAKEMDGNLYEEFDPGSG